MELAISSVISKPFSLPLPLPRATTVSDNPSLHIPKPYFKSRSFVRLPLFSRQNGAIRSQSSNTTSTTDQPSNDGFSVEESSKTTSTTDRSANDGFVVEDVPHLTDFLPDLPVINRRHISVYAGSLIFM